MYCFKIPLSSEFDGFINGNWLIDTEVNYSFCGYGNRGVQFEARVVSPVTKKTHRVKYVFWGCNIPVNSEGNPDIQFFINSNDGYEGPHSKLLIKAENELERCLLRILKIELSAAKSKRGLKVF